MPYPSSCAPQAWASAAPIGVLRALLGLEPDVPGGVVHVAPVLPTEWGAVSVQHIPIGQRRLDVAVTADGAVRCSELPGLRVGVTARRRPSS